jgi:glycosyltransferase involved in cell wall biosynthesis
MLVENAFPEDTRVKNEANALAEVGYAVTVVALRKRGQSWSDVIDGVRVYRLPRFELFSKTPGHGVRRRARFVTAVQSVVGYATEYVYFTGACAVMSVYVALRHGFDVIHAHNPPDTLFLVALPYRLFGKKFVFDHHDLCPELYRSRYNTPPDLLARVLQWIEWCNLRLADVTIATNQSYKGIHVGRGGRIPETVFVVRNGPNRSFMKQMAPPSERLRRIDKTILCYIGSLNPQDGVDYLLRSLSHLRYVLGREDFYCVIIGQGDSLPELRRLAQQLQLGECVEFTGFIPDDELRQHLAAADICVDPDPSSPLNDVSTWIKVMEYMAYGKPIVSFDLKETRFSAKDAAVFVPCNDEASFADALVSLMDDRELRKQMGRAGRERVNKDLQWSVVSRELIAAYASLGLACPAKLPDVAMSAPPTQARHAGPD